MDPNDDSAPDARRAYFADIRTVSPLSRKEEKALAERFLDGDAAAGNRLAEANLRLVAKIASDYRHYRVPYLDLIQEGNLGLLHARKKFDPARGIRFTSYASWWIRAYMLRHVMKSWSLVKVGTTQAQRRVFFRLPVVQRELAGLGEGSENDPEAIAAVLGVKTTDVVAVLPRLTGDLSLDAVAFDDGSPVTHLDLLADEDAIPADEALDAARSREAARDAVRAALEVLDRRERYVVEHRALCDEPLTLAEIGRRMGCSRERVRQLQARAYAKMRDRLDAVSP